MVTWRLTAIAEQTPKKKGSFLISLGTGDRTRITPQGGSA